MNRYRLSMTISNPRSAMVCYNNALFFDNHGLDQCFLSSQILLATYQKKLPKTWRANHVLLCRRLSLFTGKGGGGMRGGGLGCTWRKNRSRGKLTTLNISDQPLGPFGKLGGAFVARGPIFQKRWLRLSMAIINGVGYQWLLWFINGFDNCIVHTVKIH